MAASLECFPLDPASRSYTSDSDLELPQLSGSQTETENDTPPETPLRSRIPLRNSECYSCFGSSGGFVLSGLDEVGCSAVVPPPAHVFRPLSLITPSPIRASLNSFSSFGILNHDEDYGYDSEHEERVSARPAPLRLQSFRRGTREPPRTGHNEFRSNFSQMAFSSISKETRSTVSSPVTTPKLGGKPFEGASPSLPNRPRHPSPIEICSFDSAFRLFNRNEDLATGYSGAGSPRSMLSSVKDMIASPDLDQEALRRGLISTGVPFRVHKDRRNAATGLGLGWPLALRADNCSVPAMVSVTVTNQPSPRNPVLLKAPKISPVKWEDEDMSPLTLPLSMFSDSEGSYFEKTGLSVGGSSVAMESRILELEV
ncbi:hypothetical protein BDV93DRAFT_557107 [Ceratobasidium sp. AG-I]|nr:hypothetical protein BDV93DRAFT_557107 [Ceratobasidium sp. AG-I]